MRRTRGFRASWRSLKAATPTKPRLGGVFPEHLEALTEVVAQTAPPAGTAIRLSQTADEDYF